MKIDVKVKNLGKIKGAEFKVRPMTVITGENGTGKSFFTKSLYSILNVINKNIYHEAISQLIQQIRLRLETLEHISSEDDIRRDLIISIVTKLQRDFNDASIWKINDYFRFAFSKVEDVEKIKDYICSIKNIKAKQENSKPGIFALLTINLGDFRNDFRNDIKNDIKNDIEKLIDYLKKNRDQYASLFSFQIENELKENFQISNLSELISFNEKETEISAEDVFSIELGKARTTFNLGSDFIDDVACLSSVVFFESPAYWKVREALKLAKNRPSFPFFISNEVKNEDILTGVPKYFYDLDLMLNWKTKKEGVFKDLVDSLEKEIGGEFIFKDDNLSFKDNESGNQISKNLMSFGMTNLGMIQALLKHNIITAGSFVFIDEPETNLHPTWQVVLMKVLLDLAQAGVNIVITTHSTDILKALEVNVKKRKIESMNDFLSVHFVENGGLYQFESDNSHKQLIEARELLNSAYEDLYFSDL